MYGLAGGNADELCQRAVRGALQPAVRHRRHTDRLRRAGAGLQRSSTVNGITTDYVYDGSMLVREMQKNAQGILQSTATYLIGPRGPEYRRDDTQFEGTYTAGGTTYPAGKTRWYVFDGLGSVVGEVDPSGSMTSSGTYDVYGAKRAGGTGTATSRQGFVGGLGHVTDDTGLVYMQARYYDPNTGRFVSEDPSGDGNNWFVYCDNNPINETDEDGNYGKWLTAAFNGVKSEDAFYWGMPFAMVSILGAGGAKEGSSGLAVAGMLAGITSVTCFAIALGANPPQAIATLLGSGLLPVIASILTGAKEGERMAAGAGGIAVAAVLSYAGYGLEVAGALLLDEIS